MVEILNQAKVLHDNTSTSADDCMFDDTLGVKFNSFTPASTTGTECGYLNMSPVFTNDKITAKDGEEGESLVSLEKGGRQCELLQQIAAADKLVSGDPMLDRKIDKQAIALDQAQKVTAALTAKIRDTAAETLSKHEWAELSGLGKLPFGQAANGKFGEIPINLNNAQRAWLKENHPQLYTMVENFDQASLSESRASQGLRSLEQIRDQPVAARMDLVNFHRKIGDNQGAIDTLTEIAGMPRSSSMEKIFRAAAINTEAAWDKPFRRAIENSGGNILDYVERPRPMMQFQKFIGKEQLREALPAVDSQLRH